MILNILAYHIFLSPSPVGFVFVALETHLAWTYRDAFRPMLRMAVGPTNSRKAGIRHALVRTRGRHIDRHAVRAAESRPLV